VSDKTGIEWADATWNPVTGCTKVSEGCRNCYAKTFTERFEGTPGHYFESGFDVTLRPEKLEQPIRWARPRKIFVNSMSDLFHPDVPDDYIDQVFAVMALAPQHTFQLLTKRPERMRAYLNSQDRDEAIGHTAMQFYEEHGGMGDCSLPAGLIHGPGKISNYSIIEHPTAWPLPNVWIGVSVENQQAADERIPLLLQTPAVVRFLSCEPLLGPVDLNAVPRPDNAYFIWRGETGCLTDRDEPDDYVYVSKRDLIHWVIVGGESGSKARPMHPWWVQELRDQCQAAAVPFFFKQWGEWKETHALLCNEPGIKGKPWVTFDPDTSVCRIGKQAAGRELNGRTWEEFPGEVPR
jgi:protein gp37